MSVTNLTSGQGLGPDPAPSQTQAPTQIPTQTKQFSTEDYFSTQKPPAGLDEKVAVVQAFVDRWSRVTGKKVVLVTVSRRATGIDGIAVID
jgi:hypothetical protein